ncbi:MAG: molybdenum cofactor guanylyltransferase [Clostridia bacterium]|nr:molybdenum cofactor guanylyltransferase [Clostridia bacterium]
MEKKQFSGAVLTGGRSKRMGKDKASLVINGRSLLEMQLEKLRAAGIKDLMVCDAPGNGRNIPADARLVEDLLTDKGPLCAIASALSASGAECCVILSVDAAAVSAESVGKLIRTAEESSADIVILASPSGIQPLIGVYKKSLAEDALALVNSDRLAVRELFRDHPPVLLELPDDSPELLNCNTPEDLEKFTALAAERHQ